jgi:hypothetical protein
MSIRHQGSRQRRRPVTLPAVALVILALVAPSVALAGSGGTAPGPSGPRQSSGQQGAAAGTSASGGSSKPGTVGGLPFTGLDAAVLAITAAALLGAAVTLGRLSDPTRRSSSQASAASPAGRRTIVRGERNA